MLNFFKKLLNIHSLEEKAKEYVDLQDQLTLVKSEIDDLANYFAERSSYFAKSLSDSNNTDIKNSISDKYQQFLMDHTYDIQIVKGKYNVLKHKSDKLERSDSYFLDAVQKYKEIKAFDIVKSRYQDNILSREQYDNIIKAKKGKVEYADMIIYDNQGKFLLLQRSNDDNFAPNTWSLPGGHIDIGETFDDAAKRELQEETGLDVKKCEKIGEYSDSNSKIEYHTSNVDEKEPEVVLESSEHQSYKWLYWEGAKDLDMIMNLKDNLSKIFEPYKQNIITITKAYIDNKISDDIFIKAIQESKKKQRGQDKVAYVMKEFKEGRLKDSHGKIVTDRKQALAIAHSEASLSKSEDKYKEKLEKLKATRDPENIEEWPELKKSIEVIFDGYKQGKVSREILVDVLEKAKSGVYSDNATNRRLKRVGKSYGSQGKDDVKDDKEPSKDDKKTDSQPKPGTLEYTLQKMKEEGFNKVVKEGGKVYILNPKKNTKWGVSKKEYEKYKDKIDAAFSSENKDKSLEDHAKEVSGSALEQAAKESKDPEIRTAAHAELDRREKEEKPKQENDTSSGIQGGEGDKIIPDKDENKKGADKKEDKPIPPEGRVTNQGGEKKEGDLTEKEIVAISNYTGAGYKRLNKDLIEGNKLDPRQVKQINEINNALDKLPPKKGKVYRGMSMPENINEMLSDWRKGGVITMKSFTSTSLSSKTASNFGSFIMEIDSKSGKDISDLSEFKEDEKEVLFKTGTKFRVKSIKIKKYKDPLLGEQIMSVDVKLEEI